MTLKNRSSVLVRSCREDFDADASHLAKGGNVGRNRSQGWVKNVSPGERIWRIRRD